jgi:hypothetical protein
MGIGFAFLFPFKGNPTGVILAFLFGAGIVVMSWHLIPP